MTYAEEWILDLQKTRDKYIYLVKELEERAAKLKEVGNQEDPCWDKIPYEQRVAVMLLSQYEIRWINIQLETLKKP